MANLSVCGSVIPGSVETNSSSVSSSVYPLTTMIINYLATVLTEGSLTRWTEDGHSAFSWFRREFDLQLHVVFWSSGIIPLVLGIVPIGFCPRTPSFTNLSSVDQPDPLTGHRYLLHTLHDLVVTRGLTFVRNVPLYSTHPAYSLSSGVCNIMRRRPTHPPILA